MSVDGQVARVLRSWSRSRLPSSPFLECPDSSTRLIGRVQSTDLPEGRATLTLSLTNRAQLQTECLYSVLLNTDLRANLQLLNAAVQLAVVTGAAVAILDDALFSAGALSREVAMLIWAAAAVPTSPFYRAWHRFGPSAPLCPGIRRRASESDLHTLVDNTCDCVFSRQLLALQQNARDRSRAYQQELAVRREQDPDDDDDNDKGFLEGGLDDDDEHLSSDHVY